MFTPKKTSKSCKVPRLYFFVFEERLAYSKKEGYQTANSSKAIRLFEEFVDENPLDVEVDEALWNQLESYLLEARVLIDRYDTSDYAESISELVAT